MGNPKWRPYTVHNRLENLGLVNPHFAGLYEAGLLPVEIKESDAVYEDGEEVEGRHDGEQHEVQKKQLGRA